MSSEEKGETSPEYEAQCAVRVTLDNLFSDVDSFMQAMDRSPFYVPVDLFENSGLDYPNLLNAISTHMDGAYFANLNGLWLASRLLHKKRLLETKEEIAAGTEFIAFYPIEDEGMRALSSIKAWGK